MIFLWLLTEAFRLVVDDGLELIASQRQYSDELVIKVKAFRQSLFNPSSYLISAFVGF